jgi:hypothetical protein
MKIWKEIMVTLLLSLAVTVSSQATTLSLMSNSQFTTSTGAGGRSNSNSNAIFSTSTTSYNDGEGYGFAQAGFGSLTSDNYTFAMYTHSGADAGYHGDGSASSTLFFQVIGSNQESGNSASFKLAWSGFTKSLNQWYGYEVIHVSPLTVTLNGTPILTIPDFSRSYILQSFDEQFSDYTFFNVPIGGIIGITCSTDSDARYDDNPWGGSIDAFSGLQVSLTSLSGNSSPVPLPGAVFLLGSGLLRLAHYRLRKQASNS